VEGGRPLSASPRGALTIAAVNGFVGDDLEREGSGLALPMTIRSGGRDLSPRELAAELPDAGPAVAVFVHGLCESERAWWLRPRGHEGPVRSYGQRLAADLGLTPVYLRYNTGLQISENGRRLAELMEQLVAHWPVPVERIALVGHSMGGLVARSACHQGHAAGMGWTHVVRQVVCLGTPHLGAPLEKAANAAALALAALPETRPLASIVNVRSEGIKGLGGALVAPLLENADHRSVGATVTRTPDGPVAGIVGDLLVQYSSASACGECRHIGGINHFDLLNHPEVYATLREWLSEPAPAGPAAA
jgi:pimeloyl-ACP methyl ester carboxylesterase